MYFIFTMDKFIVNCQKLGRAQKYGITFLYNTQLIERIKSFSREEREFKNNIWILKTYTLYNLILIYKGSNKIKFEFIGENAKEIFKDNVNKILVEEQEKQRKIEELERNKKEWLEFKADLDVNYEKYSEIVHKNLKEGTKLYAHQISAVMFGQKVNNVLYALSMGTGKSLVSITLCEMNQYEKVIVLTPNSLKFNYLQEIQKFTNSTAHIVGWKNNQYTIEQAKYIIINYEFFNISNKEKTYMKWEKLGIRNINALVLDECQKLQHTKNNTYKNFKKVFNDDLFFNKERHFYFLSGTPVTNEISNLYTVLNLISPLDFPNKSYFFSHYCGLQYNIGGYGYVINPEEVKYEELYYKIEPYCFRKKLENVVQMPEKQIQKILLELDDKDQKIYNELEEGIANEFFNETVTNPLTVMLRLRQFLSNVKIKAICELIDIVLENQDKIVIFDVFKASLLDLKNRYKDIVALHTGDQSIEERAEIIKEFQDKSSNKKIFLTTFGSGNYGITLHAANKMSLLTLPFSYAEYDQSQSRVWRIGQYEHVMIYPFVVKNTIDEYVFARLEARENNMKKVFDNEDYKSDVNENYLNDIIKIIKEKHKK